MSDGDTKAVARRFYEVILEDRAAPWGHLGDDLTEDVLAAFREVSPVPLTAKGDMYVIAYTSAPAEELEKLFGMLGEAFPDSHYRVDDLLADGDRVAVRLHWSGTCHNREERFAGIRPGQQVNVDGVSILRFTGGKIAEIWSLWGRLSVKRDAGVTPASE